VVPAVGALCRLAAADGQRLRQLQAAAAALSRRDRPALRHGRKVAGRSRLQQDGDAQAVRLQERHVHLQEATTMNISDITLEMAAGLWAHMSKVYGTEVIDKDDSAMMEAVGGFLGTFGVLDKTNFMENYGTTIIKNIYIPFRPGEISKRWYPAAQCSMCIHEHKHAWQSDDEGTFVFASAYLSKKSSRATYEAQAYSTNMEFWYWLTGRMNDPARYARRIKNYNCGDEEVAFVRDYLRMSIPMIEDPDEGFISPVVREAVAYLNSCC
jgi:hypothetical protein